LKTRDTNVIKGFDQNRGRDDRRNVMPIIKAKIAKSFTDSLADIAKKKRERIVVLFTEYEKEDWAIGGELASDIDQSKK
jgi:4-oxalocrotonate tautomerase family enzyme